MKIVNFIKLFFIKIKWKIQNKHNDTHIVNAFDTNYVDVGIYTYGELFVLSHGNTSKLHIGNFCSIAPEVAFILNSDHDYRRISSFPYKAKVMGLGLTEAKSKGDIVIKDDVWIGYRTIILSGVTIGQGAVIAAGSIITKDVPPYSIVAGNPAKVIKYRFDNDKIKKLLEIDYGKLTKTEIINHIDELYCEFKSDDQILWMK